MVNTTSRFSCKKRWPVSQQTTLQAPYVTHTNIMIESYSINPNHSFCSFNTFIFIFLYSLMTTDSKRLTRKTENAGVPFFRYSHKLHTSITILYKVATYIDLNNQLNLKKDLSPNSYLTVYSIKIKTQLSYLLKWLNVLQSYFFFMPNKKMSSCITFLNSNGFIHIFIRVSTFCIRFHKKRI